MAGKVLVVDDDASVQRLLQQTLRGEGYEVLIATEAAEALRLWQQETPVLVLLDVTLPGMDGYDLAVRIRGAEAAGRHVPIIMLTSDRDASQKVKALRSGADDYLVKPFHPAELLARIKALIARFAPGDSLVGRPPMGRIHAYYGAKGGVGTTTIAINTAIALRSLDRRVVLVDGNLQFGDHRVFMDLANDRKSIVDAVSAPTIDADLLRGVIQSHESGVDLLLAPPSPEAADHVTAAHLHEVLQVLATMYDYVIVDIDKRLDELNLMVLDIAETIFAVMTADLSCLKNVRLVLGTIGHLGYQSGKLKLVLNRSNAYTGINVKSAEGALRQPIEHQIVNEYRGAISALNTGAPFMAAKADSVLGRSVLDFAKAIDKAPARSAPQLAPGQAR
ncbi:MAG TPA: response regulator [Candidatus Limnocylindrales bacterium]